MEAVLQINRQWGGWQDKTSRVVVIAALLILFSMSIANVIFAFDISGGYLSIKTIGETGVGDSVLVIGAIGSGLSSLDLGMGGALPHASPGVARVLLRNLLPVIIASGIFIAVIRSGGGLGLLVGAIIGLITFVIVLAMLG